MNNDDLREEKMSDAMITDHLYADERAVKDAGTTEEKWSARRTVLFCIVACGAFWIAVAALVFGYLF
ncbi:MAG: hypothetical protein CMK07_02860 [Ponticaulis sp.]|nr:hypothetical protein [Ponticaulis sp.]